MQLPPQNPVRTVEVAVSAPTIHDLIEAPDFAIEALQSNDLRKLTPSQKTETIRYLCRKYRLPTDEGLITVIVKDGSVKPYVTAAGVFMLSRDKVKSLSVRVVDSPNGYVTLIATAVTLDGRSFEAIGCKRSIADYDIAIMRADTAARVRACKAAVGLSLMTYAEASSLDESQEGINLNEGSQAAL